MDKVFSEIRVSKVSDEIVQQVIHLITDGKLKPGDKLPSERDLVDELGVGRSSLREALSILETLGFVEIRKRRGIFVKGIVSALSLDPLRRIFEDDLSHINQLFDIRNDIELAATYAAAKNRTDQDLEEIDSHKRLPYRAKAKDDDVVWDMDQGFHIAIAQSTHNFLRVHTINHLFDFTRGFVEQWFAKLLQEERNVATINEQHEAIFQAIERQDPEGARAAMQQHLNWTNRKVVESIPRVEQEEGDLSSIVGLAKAASVKTGS